MIKLSLPDRPTPIFAGLRERSTDGLVALMRACREDPRPDKIDLGIGVYRDENGATPVMAAVKRAERRLLETQQTKTYLGVAGDAGFTAHLAAIVFGQDRAADPRLLGMQTPGGTGALRVANELIAAASPSATLWMGEPSWANHLPIAEAAGLRVARHPFFDPLTRGVAFDAMMDELQQAQPGDALLLHGCCHNPTGAAFTAAQWHGIAELVARRRLLPLLDLAYQGLGQGLDDDALGVRLLFDRAEALIVAYSCDKNFGLYRERTGALWVRTSDTGSVERVRAGMLNPARASWSMPPDHGAAVVRTILEAPDLTALWRTELETMRCRIVTVRQRLAMAHPLLAPLASQTGMFALLPLRPADVVALRTERGIYMADDGRVNLAGLCLDTIAPLVAALAPRLEVLA